jgi:hypothetical protein
LLSAPQSDEVVEVFDGDTLEEAMARAVAVLGPDLTVRHARRVRKGVQGLRGKERYEVMAVRAPHTSGDVLGNAFASLLSRAEHDEDAAQPHPVRRTARPAEERTGRAVLTSVPEILHRHEPDDEVQLFDQELLDQELLDQDPLPQQAFDRKPVAVPQPQWSHQPTQEAADAPHPLPGPSAPRPEAAPRPSVAPVPNVVAIRQPTKGRAASAPATARRTGGSGWNRRTLAHLGLPRWVLAALPADDPQGDLAWVAALEQAFATGLPAADPTGAVVVSGTGLEGVLGVLAGARRGLTPGTITYAGRTAPATATELALVVRAEVLR